MDSRIIDSSTVSHYDEAEDSLTIQRIQDIDPIIKRNMIEQSNFQGFSTGEMYRAFSVPLLVIEIWKKEYGVDILKRGSEDFLKERMNDSNYEFLRTIPKGIRI